MKGVRWDRTLADPLDVFTRMVNTGNREKVSAALGYHPRSLSTMARYRAARGEYALLFALEAGRHLYLSRRAQRVRDQVQAG